MGQMMLGGGSANISSLIRIIRGKRVMLDSDLADLYEVETRVLNQAVKRNIKRFPDDFMFQLSTDEAITNCEGLSKRSNQHTKRYVFTELGSNQLSAVLSSSKSVEVSIRIQRAFLSLQQQKPLEKMSRREIAMAIIQAEDERDAAEKALIVKTTALAASLQKNVALSVQDQIVKDYLSRTDLLTFEEVAGIARIRMKHFNKILKGLMLREDGRVYANILQSGRMRIVPSVEGSIYPTETMFTPKGAVWLYRTFIVRPSRANFVTERLPDFET